MASEKQLVRRTFLKQGTLFIASVCGGATAWADISGTETLLRIGLVTDLHYADKEPTKTRFYRETLAKLAEAVERFNNSDLAFVIELGDLIDQAPTVEREIGWLDTVERVFAKAKAPRHYVLGNHCVTTLTKEEFAAHTAAAKSPHYAFDAGGIRFIILDACFSTDGTPYGRGNAEWTDANIPQAQVRWLQEQLASTKHSAVVFVHQRLDIAGKHSVRNAAEVRGVLERSGKVAAVFQGHSHKNELQIVSDIPYVTLAALIEGAGQENNSYGILDVMKDGSLRIEGFRKLTSRKLERRVQNQ